LNLNPPVRALDFEIFWVQLVHFALTFKYHNITWFQKLWEVKGVLSDSMVVPEKLIKDKQKSILSEQS
jgi:hypothetical protein